MGIIAEETKRVAIYESDIFGKLLPTEAMNYFQETSTNQGEELGVGSEFLEESQLAWFLVKYDIHFNGYPEYKESVKIKTEATGMDRYCAVRRFSMERENDLPSIHADTQWLLINRETEKMEAIDKHKEFDVYGCFEKREPIFRRIPRVKNPFNQKKFEVRFLDIDINHHVNHVHYLAWAIETLPLSVIETKVLKRAKIVFKAQAFYGDQVLVVNEKFEENDFLVEIINQKKQLLCQLELILQ